MSPACRVATSLLALLVPATACAEDACFDEDLVFGISAPLPIVATLTDELARAAVKHEAATRSDVYLLARQLVLVERIQRRVEAREPHCVTSLERLKRDFDVLRRTHAAFRDGDQDLGIEALAVPGAGEVLARIDPELDKLAAAMGALPASPD